MFRVPGPIHPVVEKVPGDVKQHARKSQSQCRPPNDRCILKKYRHRHAEPDITQYAGDIGHAGGGQQRVEFSGSVHEQISTIWEKRTSNSVQDTKNHENNRDNEANGQ